MMTMTTFAFMLLLVQTLPPPVPELPLLTAAPTQVPVNHSLDRYKPEPFLDKGQIPPLPANNRDENLIANNLQVIAHMCKKSEVPGFSCSCPVEALSALEIAADPGEPSFTRVAGLYAIAIAAKQGCRDPGSLAHAVLQGLQSEPPADVCVQTVFGDFVRGAITEMPCTVFDNGLNVVEAAIWAAVYFGPDATQFKSALEHIAADTDQKRHGTTIAAAKEALSHLEKLKQ